ncbi:transcriptional regulator, ArsR family [Alteromonadaceae bacterium Bs31]|nr:transcriptional regulator, ArsR family [Alteromonadaceae bacterium Bs31]
MGMYSEGMSRVKTTYDVFSAIGDPKRRVLIEHLALKEMTVNELVTAVKWSQPTVSKHLSVLKKVGVVSEVKEGRYRRYRVQPEELRPIQEWMHQFEKYWGNTLDQLDSYLNQIQLKGDGNEH